MNQYDPVIEEIEASSTPAIFGAVRTILIVVTCIFIAVRDLPHAQFGGLIFALIFTVISWTAIRMRWAYWVGAILSALILFRGFDLLRDFQNNTYILSKILYGGVVVPLLLASIMFIGHFFISGRLRE